MPNSDLAFGVDISKYNTSPDGSKKVNFDIVASHFPLVSFVGMRAGISWGYQDPWFSFYFQEVTRIGRVRLPYHVIYPGENPVSQMDNFFRILGSIDFEHTPLVLDCELDHGQTRSKITSTIAQSIRIITERSGRIPLIYSRSSWVDRFLQVADLPPVFWWLAQYRYSLPYPLYTPEYPCPPTPLPIGVPSWSFHQTSMRSRSIGTQAMYYMDYNRFNGSVADLKAFAYGAPSRPIVCPVDNNLCTGGKTTVDFPEVRVQLGSDLPLPSWLGHSSNFSPLKK
jgi:GH25 family lysozyme M1 (1,4-beta-N-acetylmuramidase)